MNLWIFLSTAPFWQWLLLTVMFCSACWAISMAGPAFIKQTYIYKKDDET
jgi:hypothetical protein